MLLLHPVPTSADAGPDLCTYIYIYIRTPKMKLINEATAVLRQSVDHILANSLLPACALNVKMISLTKFLSHIHVTHLEFENQFQSLILQNAIRS